MRLRPARREELARFDEMDRQAHARDFVLQTGLALHEQYFSDPRITYLSIENDGGEFCGYFILVHESERDSVEFRRILVDQHQRGVGQAAITEMERYCRHQLGVSRIWLDVFEDNPVGIHIYEKLGYVRYGEETTGGRKLFLYEKSFAPADL